MKFTGTCCEKETTVLVGVRPRLAAQVPWGSVTMTRPMKQTVAVTVAASLALAGLVLAWSALRQDREFQRLIAQGDVALTADQTFGAIEAFSGAMTLKPDSMVAHLKRGDTYLRRGELRAALRDLRDAVALDPTATRPRELLGDVHVALGRHDRAAQYYQSFIALDERSPRVLYKLALTHYRDGNAAAAIDPLHHAVALDDRVADAHHLLGLCLRAQERHAEALAPLQKALDLNPGLSAAREELADLLSTLGRTGDAIEQLEALAAIEPARAQPMVAVGLAYARTGRTDAAILTLGRAAERYPEEPTVYTALGRVWLSRADAGSDASALPKALEALGPVATRSSATSETLALFGRALLLSGDVNGAVRVLEQAVTRFPVEPSAFVTLATAAEKAGRPATARDALVSHVALTQSDDDRLAARIAELSLRIDDGAAALLWARRATIRDADAFRLVLLADALDRTGQAEAARQTLAQALAREPQNAFALRLRRRWATRSDPRTRRLKVAETAR